MANYRDRRVAQEILKEVNQVLRKSVRDPRVENVNITDVHVTGLIRREIGKALTLYKTPEITFELDESVAYGSKIDEMLRKLNQE